jgi:glucan phosphorylase
MKLCGEKWGSVHVAIHINYPHPALAIPEMMRILIDEEGFY